MARKFFTADFHLGMASLLELEHWPFKSIEAHDQALVRSCVERAKADDVIYHLGDLASYGFDNHFEKPSKGLGVKPTELLKDVKAVFINIRGNHDLNNKVKSVCDAMHMFLSKRYPSVSLSHYPTYDPRIDVSCMSAPIHLCGHVHGKFRHCLDLDRRILNVNVGCVAWGFKIVSDDELIAYLNKLFRLQPQQLFQCKRDSRGKLAFRGNPDV